MRCFLFVVVQIFLVSILPAFVFAQEEPPEVNLTTYCKGNETAPFRIGVDSNFDIEFRATFADKSPGKRLQLYFIDGNVQNGKVNEQRITRMKCSPQGEGEVCVGTISLERSQKLENSFNFDQAVINVSLRQGKRGKDLCLGKFTNDPEKISRNSRTERIFCSFIPTDESNGVTGEGHFNPGGYGTEADAHFHLRLTGLEAGNQYRGCSVTGENRYRQAFTFTSYDANTTDAEIFGALNEDEQAEFNARKIDYSYDLYRSVNAVADADLQSLFSINLSQINFGISSSSASQARKSGNRKRARARRRRRRKNANRRRRAFAMAYDMQSVRANSFGEDVFKWLSFDPNSGGEVYIADKCKGDVPTNSYGRIVCGDSVTVPDDRNCITLTGDDESLTANACKEPKSGYNLVSLRVKDFEDGEYTVCIDGIAVSEKLTVETDEVGAFAELEITDNATIEEQMTNAAFFSGDLSSVSTVGISETEDCATTIQSGSF